MERGYDTGRYPLRVTPVRYGRYPLRGLPYGRYHTGVNIRALPFEGVTMRITLPFEGAGYGFQSRNLKPFEGTLNGVYPFYDAGYDS